MQTGQKRVKGLTRSIGLYKILFYFEAYVHESMIFFVNTTVVWAPYPPPLIAHTIAQYIVSPRPPFIAIYTIQFFFLMTISWLTRTDD